MLNVSSKSAVRLHFAHANGFPSASYNKLFNALPEDWEILSIDKFGHSVQYPVISNWRKQIDELNDFLAANDAEQAPIYAVGHSLGALISYMSACHAPALYRGVIMLDPPVITGVKATILRFARHTKWINKITPANKAMVRRRVWPKGTDLVQYFAQRGLFKNMDKQCVADYVKAVIDERDSQLTLNFDPDIEAELFRNLPVNLGRYRGRLQCPGHMITGTTTDVSQDSMIKPFVKQNRMVHSTLPGGHMFPLEHPEQVAASITDIIANWHQAS